MFRIKNLTIILIYNAFESASWNKNKIIINKIRIILRSINRFFNYLKIWKKKKNLIMI